MIQDGKKGREGKGGDSTCLQHSCCDNLFHRRLVPVHAALKCCEDGAAACVELREVLLPLGGVEFSFHLDDGELKARFRRRFVGAGVHDAVVTDGVGEDGVRVVFVREESYLFSSRVSGRGLEAGGGRQSGVTVAGERRGGCSMHCRAICSKWPPRNLRRESL